MLWYSRRGQGQGTGAAQLLIYPAGATEAQRGKVILLKLHSVELQIGD